jgi:hypothetical protein
MSSKQFAALFWMLAFLVGLQLVQSCGDLASDIVKATDEPPRGG